MSSYVETDNKNQSDIKSHIERIIGSENLTNILDDVVGSSQALIADLYEGKEGPGQNEGRIKNLYAGDGTSDGCIVWVKDPNTHMAYSIKMEFKYLEHRPL